MSGAPRATPALSLAALEEAVRAGHFDALGESHSHRAVLEDSISVAKGRDLLIARRIAEPPALIAIAADLGDMIAVRGRDADGADAPHWSLHRWVWSEDGRILREVEVTDRPRPLAPPQLHPPIGELNAGRGQYAAADEPALPADFPAAAAAFARRLHRRWNARAFADGIEPAMAALLRALPDAVVTFEHAVVRAGGIAILARLMGHTPDGRRIRLFLSALHIDRAESLVVDQAAYAAQQSAQHIDYGAG